MSELRYNDFRQMTLTSVELAEEFGEDNPNFMLVDEQGNTYPIDNVRYNPVVKAVLLEFNHDDSDGVEELED